MNSERPCAAGVCAMDESSKLWSMPWHVRLKNLADTVRPESAHHVRAALKATRGQSAVDSVPKSWLVRARSLSVAVHP
jgi:hypothetical protein